MKRAVLFVVALACGACACNDGACVTRGTSTFYEGTATWSGTSSGAATTIVQVDDLDRSVSCDESYVELTVRVNECLLWVVMTGVGGRRDVAAVEPGQTCTFPLGSETVTLTTDDTGSLRVGSGVRLFVSGTTGAGSVQWTFQT